MTGKKKSNFYRKKRKGKPFKGVQTHAKKAKETPPADIKTPLVNVLINRETFMCVQFNPMQIERHLK